MCRLLSGLLVAGLAFLLAGNLTAEDTKKPEKKPAKANDPYAGIFSFPKQITLDDKQKEKIDALKKEYSPKLAEIDKKRNEVVAPDRYKAANEAKKKATPEATEARKKAADEGKGKKEQAKIASDILNKAYNDALKLTPDEKKQLAAINKERGQLVKEINTKKMAVLTDEQKEALKPKKKKTDK
jgi:Spy/CpxP family protein refolding chaperone